MKFFKYCFFVMCLLGTGIATAQEQTQAQVQEEDVRTLDDVARLWQHKEIKVKSLTAKPTITSLVKSFNKMLPTTIGNELDKWIDHPKTFPGNENEEYLVVDRPNGYVSFWKDGDGPYMSACMWRRSDGHFLLAYRLGQPGETHDEFVCFYDYNPIDKMLSPDSDPLAGFKPSFDNTYVTIELPRKGKTIIVDEYIPNWQRSLNHLYEYDGRIHHFARVEIEGMEQMQELYRKACRKKADFAKYVLVDIDNDLEPELWLRSADGNHGAIFALREGDIALLAIENTKAWEKLAHGHGAILKTANDLDWRMLNAPAK